MGAEQKTVLEKKSRLNTLRKILTIFSIGLFALGGVYGIQWAFEAGLGDIVMEKGPIQEIERYLKNRKKKRK